ncbi:MAG: hypothetical protein WBD31_11840 [Rubripirellula sp.]
MSRSFAVSLGTLAMALVVLRGAIGGELAGRVACESIVALIIFAGVGYVAGWIADYLVRDALERNFRARVDWYREGLTDSVYDKTKSSKD